MKRNNFLDVLKGICILLVILIHIDFTESQRLWLLFPFWVNPAVPIFMIISGYVNTLSFEKNDVTALKTAYAPKGILTKYLRFTVPLVLFFPLELLLTRFVLNYHLPFWHTLFKFATGGFGPGGYYYACMIGFIFIFPLIYFAIKKWDFKGLLLCFGANLFYELIKLPLCMTQDVFRLLVFRYVFLIALGVYFAIGKFKIKKWMGIVSLLCGGAFLVFAAYTNHKPVIFFREWVRTCLFAALFIAPIAYVLVKKCSFGFKPLEIIGKASYSIMFAQKIFFCIVNRTHNGVDPTFLPILLTFTICVGGGLLFDLVQTPVTNWIIKQVNKLFAKKDLLKA